MVRETGIGAEGVVVEGEAATAPEMLDLVVIMTACLRERTATA